MLTEETNIVLSSADRAIEVKSLADLWMHQNTLMWSRIQLLSALQAAAIASNYVLRNKISSIFLFLVVIVATAYLNYIWEVDRKIRNSYNARLFRLGFKVGLSAEERRQMSVSILGFKVPADLNAQVSLRAIFWGMLVIDVVVFLASVIIFPC